MQCPSNTCNAKVLYGLVHTILRYYTCTLRYVRRYKYLLTQPGVIYEYLIKLHSINRYNPKTNPY